MISISIKRRPEGFLRKLARRSDIEDALKRLDRLTQEEAQMALAEVLKATHYIREIVINDARAHLLVGAIHVLYTLRRKRGESNGDGITIYHPTSGNRHRLDQVKCP